MSLGRAKTCDYGCGQLIAWDKEEGYFVEIENNNKPHPRTRCEELKGSKPVTSQAKHEVKEAVNSDLMMACLQELRRANGYLAKIAGEEHGAE